MNTRRIKASALKSISSFADDEPGKRLHIRLCHHCLKLNESESIVDHCEKCNRPLNTGIKIDELNANELTDLSRDQGVIVRKISSRFQMDFEDPEENFFPPLNGLNVIW